MKRKILCVLIFAHKATHENILTTKITQTTVYNNRLCVWCRHDLKKEEQVKVRNQLLELLTSHIHGYVQSITGSGSHDHTAEQLHCIATIIHVQSCIKYTNVMFSARLLNSFI